MIQPEIIGLTVCYHFSDVFSYTLEKNIDLFSKWYIITSEKDIETINLVNSKKNNKIELIYYPFEDHLNKSNAIKKAQEIIYKKHPDKYVLIIDADIIIPEDLKIKIYKELEQNINTDIFYSIRRSIFLDIKSYEESNLKTQIKNIYKQDAVGLGYFQLYFNKNIFYPSGPHSSNSFWGGDFKFFMSFVGGSWKRKRTNVKILDGHVIHLGKTGRWKIGPEYSRFKWI